MGKQSADSLQLYEFENGTKAYFKSLGHALEYAAKHSTRVLRRIE